MTAYPPPDLDMLAARIAKLQRRSRYQESSALMPVLLAELRHCGDGVSGLITYSPPCMAAW